MSDTMTIDTKQLYNIVQSIPEGTAQAMPDDCWYPERADTILKRVNILFDRDYPQREEFSLTIEDAQDPDLVLSPEQAMYAITTALAYELKDEYAEVEKLKKIAEKGGQQGKSFREKYTQADAVLHNRIDNTLRWLMDNAPDHFTVMWGKTAFAIFRIKFEPSQLKNWEEFSEKFQDAILEDNRS